MLGITSRPRHSLQPKGSHLLLRDPREGYRRQRRTLQQILQQLAQRRQAVAGRTGPGRMGRAIGSRGPRLAGLRRPTGGISFLQPLGLNTNPGARLQARPVGVVRAAAASPPPAGLQFPAGPPPAPSGRASGVLYPEIEPGLGLDDPTAPWGAPGTDSYGSGGWLGPQVNQSSPNAPITVGGMIPLGGGQYLDPETLVIHGAGSGRP